MALHREHASPMMECDPFPRYPEADKLDESHDEVCLELDQVCVTLDAVWGYSEDDAVRNSMMTRIAYHFSCSLCFSQ